MIIENIENFKHIAEVIRCCSKGINEFNSKALRNNNSGHMSWGIWSGSSKEILKTPLNIVFRYAIIKYPSNLDMYSDDELRIRIRVQENCLPEVKVITCAPNTDDGDHNITIFGIGRFIYDQTGFSFTEDMPSPVEAVFRKRFMKICNLLGKDYTVYQFENRNLLLTSAQSYESWIDVLDHCFHEPCKDWEQLLTEIKEARRLIDGKFNLHAIIAKEEFARKHRSNNNV